MTIRRLLAAFAALSLALAPDLAPAEPKVRIRDDQYSGLISGASFVSNYVSVTGHYVELDPPEWYSDEDYPDDETQVPEGWPTNWVEILENWRWGEYVYATNRIAAPWAGSNETWTAEGGFSPHYWPSTNGISRLGPDGILALYGRYELARVHPRVWDAMYAWRNTSQPAAYGSVSENRYANLYAGRHEDDTGLGVVVVDTEPGARVVCNMAKDGAPVQVDDVVYYDGMVAFEPFAAGEGNRPADLVTEDAQVAVYMQDRPGSEVPYLYVVARDWVTGAVRHYAVGSTYYRYGLEARTEYGGRTFYCGRLTICAMRTIYADSRDPVVPGIAVFVGGSPVYYCENPYWTPPPSTLTWGHVRSDLGFTVDARHQDLGGAGERDWDGHLLVFRPLNADSAAFTLSGVSYDGSFRLGAYTVSRANPLSTVWLWPGWTDAMRELSIQGYVDVAAAAAVEYGIPVNVESPAQSFGTFWHGANGWADENYNDVAAGGGCSVTLDESCFRHGRAYLDSADGLTDEDWAALEAGGLPHVSGRTGPLYVNVRDALTHAVYLGGTVSVLADPESILGIGVTGLVQDVELDAAGHAVVATNVTIAGAGPDAGFSLTSCRIDGTVRVTGVATRVDGTVYGGRVVLDGVPVANLMADITPVVKPAGVNYVSDLPEGTIPDEARYALLATNSRTRINRGRIVGDMYVAGGHSNTTAGDPDFEIRGGSMTGRIVLDNVPFATIGGCSMYSDIRYADLPRPHRSESLMTTNVNITINDGYYRGDMHVTGGSLRVTGGDFANDIVATGASPVSVTGGHLSEVSLYDCGIQEFSPNSCETLTVSNSPAITVAHTAGSGGSVGVVRALDVGELRISTALSTLEAYRVGKFSIDSGVTVSSAVFCDTPFSATNGSFTALVVSNSTVAIDGSHLGLAAFDRCETVSVTNGTFTVELTPGMLPESGRLPGCVFSNCGAVSVAGSSFTRNTHGFSGTVDEGGYPHIVFDHCAHVSVTGSTFSSDIRANRTYGFDYSSLYVAGGDSVIRDVSLRALALRDGAVRLSSIALDGLYPPEDAGVCASNCTVVVEGGVVAYPIRNWSSDHGAYGGGLTVYDSTLRIEDGVFGVIRALGASSVTVLGGAYHQDAYIDGAESVVISGGVFGDVNNRTGRWGAPGSVTITNATSVTISGNPVFAKPVSVYMATSYPLFMGGTFYCDNAPGLIVYAPGTVAASVSGATFVGTNGSSLGIRRIGTGKVYLFKCRVLKTDTRPLKLPDGVIVAPGHTAVDRGDSWEVN